MVSKGLKRSSILFSFAVFLATAAIGQTPQRIVGGRCEDCELMYQGMPKLVLWETTLVANGEPGEPMEISGRILKADGKTVAPGVILYVYHTDAKGYYSPSPDQTHARRHGHIRGWMKTDSRGRYKFRTVRPAHYPGSRIPEHIHPTIKEPDKNEYYIDEYRFDDDPLLTESERTGSESRGGSGIVSLKKDEQGVWIGKRDIILGQAIPNYPK